MHSACCPVISHSEWIVQVPGPPDEQTTADWSLTDPGCIVQQGKTEIDKRQCQQTVIFLNSWSCNLTPLKSAALRGLKKHFNFPWRRIKWKSINSKHFLGDLVFLWFYRLVFNVIDKNREDVFKVIICALFE